ncbi:MAG: histidine--tRNA ligase [Candidatus Cloacimonetes bacterium]|nr:histidine--tRNA ligase [Candidatus Cloacimonadota bacterium]MDD2543313.1 histidine--tRNA ligase [Candidatus Cloacimonadota bacterium]MDD2683709.1 histidine--tRNA ligase [Candidatus Cloacimonadota bacterium]MDD3096441.1 histidine--tRNA ligase [Candidatus Cloacimonadota bacterium]MDD3578026.1 histidine--tRNA ligase [Candidatus Cloacimonadota bacterium]
MNYKIPRGTFDILPADSSKWQYVQQVFRKVAASFGYREITTPIFEMAELFERSSGESSDVVQKEMYRFTDQKGRSFALRPEGTAPVVRSYVENHLEMQGGRTRLYYMGPMFRYDRPQAGRYRQFYQYGVEFIGSNHPYYDAEVIALEMTFLKALGLTRPRLEINSVGCAECARDYDKALRDYYAPHLNELCPDCQKRYELKPRRLLDCKVPSCKAFRKDAPSQFDYLDASCREHFDAVCRYLDQMKISYQINPAIVRGLDYYTNTAFELICDELGAQNSIAGGGRYNALIAQVGGKDTPGIGFAGGFERLLLALEKENIQLPQNPNPALFMVLMGEEAVDFALPLIAELRQKGIYVDYNPEKGSFKAQLKAADSMNARYALIIGEHEAISRTLVLKDLSSGEQQSLSADELLSFPFEA